MIPSVAEKALLVAIVLAALGLSLALSNPVPIGLAPLAVIAVMVTSERRRQHKR